MPALEDVTFSIERGECVAILGQNGSGKSTLVRVLSTLLLPDGGRAEIFGHDVVAEPLSVRRRIGLAGQFAAVDEELTGRENLVLLGRLLGYSRAAARSRADELLDAFDIAEAGGRLVKHFSGGMRRRLDIAASIVVTPRLMFPLG